MIINLDTGTASTDELTALIALCASLGGRLPVVAHDGSRWIEAADLPGMIAPIPPIEMMPPTSDPAERLIAAEAARVAALPGTASDPKQLDADGIPWDERIHSGNPTLTGDGRWRKKRGVSEVYYGQIHAELAGTGTTSEPATPTVTTIAETPAAPPPPVSPAPTAPAASAPVATDGAGRWPDYATFVQAVSAIRQPTIPYAELNDMAQALGLVKFIDLRERADLWAQFYGMAGGQ